MEDEEEDTEALQNEEDACEEQDAAMKDEDAGTPNAGTSKAKASRTDSQQ